MPHSFSITDMIQHSKVVPNSNLVAVMAMQIISKISNNVWTHVKVIKLNLHWEKHLKKKNYTKNMDTYEFKIKIIPHIKIDKISNSSRFFAGI